MSTPRDTARGTDIDAVRISLRLRPTLLGVVLGLLLATVACIGGIAFVKTSETVENLAAQQFDAVNHAVVERVRALVSAPPLILREYEAQLRLGTLTLDDLDAVGLRMAERIRQNPELAWIGYADMRAGRFIGATRRGETISIFTALPWVDGGIPTVEAVSPAGVRRAAASPETEPYVVAEKAWIRRGLQQQDLAWLDPYVFTDGQRGISAVLPLRPETGMPADGLLHVDVFITTLQQFLGRFAVGRTGRVHLLDAGGARIASPVAWDGGDPLLAAAVQALGGGQALRRVEPGAERSFLFESGARGWRAAFDHVAIPGGPDWIVAVVAPESEFTGLARRNAALTAAIAAATLLAAIAAAIVVSRRIAEPLRIISHDLERLAVFDFGARPAPPSFVREVEVVRRTAARMKASLRSFGHYVPTELVRDMVASGAEAKLGGERRRLTIHFSDIAGFTSVSEKLTPEQLVEELGAYFVLMREVLRERRGTLDKYMGDGILAFFNAPHPVPGHEAAACEAALDAQARLAEDGVARRAAGRPVFRARIGLATGDVVVGNFGTPDRFAYTVLGDAVNLASRLEGLCKFYGVAIVACGGVRAATGDSFEWRALDRVAVVGREAGTDIHQLLGRKGELAPPAAARRDAYEAALADYLDARFASAAQRFRELATADAGDIAAATMARRARKLARTPPAGPWTGIYVMTSK